VEAAYWTHIVELYEYKVDDMLNARTPKGGPRSLRELRELLTGAPLAGTVLRRFRVADKALRGKGEEAAPTEVLSEKPAPVELELAPEPATQILEMDSLQTVEVVADAIDEEGATLRDLANAAWQADFTDELFGLAMKLRNEPGRNTARGVFAMVQNLEQYADSSDFNNDINLAKFRVLSRVPQIDDPLASFSSPEVIENMLGDFAKKLLKMSSEHPKLQLPISETVAYLRRFALAVAEDHRAGEQMVVQGPGTKEIQSAMDEVRKENLSADAKQEMLNRLGQQLNAVVTREREYQQALHDERRALKNALEAFFTWVAERVPARWGGRAKDMTIPSQVLGAQVPSRNLESVPADATEVTVRLSRPGHAVLDSLPVHWRHVPEGWVLEVADAEYPLRDGLRVPAEDREVLVFVHAGYALLRSRRREGGGLWKLLTLTRCVAALLEPEDDYQALRLARAAVGWLRDRRVDTAQHSPESAERYRGAPEQTLTSFARTGAEKLLERFERSNDAGAIERCFKAAAEGLYEDGLDQVAERLIKLFQAVLEPETIEPIDGLEVRNPDEVLLIAYRGEPVTVRIMGRAFTVRTDNLGKVYAIQAGAGGQSLEDVLPQRIPGGFALLAREGLRIAIGFMKSV
jgi:hypothetical protein